ncbi:MAG TPA: type IV pilus twitching motility protein PilT [Candidatus Eremiobacteraeota bacterium]|nr:MAG: Twitching mobility protein [bacterium ADurb.Bin363]HPZ07678.1 type IV pilus twitching motility protein PilT [Candidatus Eremiobacteraeota bacterium]
MDIFLILATAVEVGASDIHIVIGVPPMVRITGQMVPMEDFGVVSAEDAKDMIYSILYDDQKQKFEEKFELDCSYDIPGVSRFRVNVYLHKDGVGAVFRVISPVIPTPQELMLSETVVELTGLPKGLILVTGPTGSGKSTTLASLIDHINRRRKVRILTIEDPIEFVHEKKYAVITQREIGSQTHSFANALRSALREDPDIILVGEMRDLETISLALTAAETGHLIFATLHTSDAPQTVDRIVDVFPSYQQQQIRVQVSTCLKAVICQNLLSRSDGKGRIAAREILIVNPAVSNLIRQEKTHQIYSAIETSARLGMITMDRSLANLVKEGLITIEEALGKAGNPEQVARYVTGSAY